MNTPEWLEPGIHGAVDSLDVDASPERPEVGGNEA
jgi:hypothetical protein